MILTKKAQLKGFKIFLFFVVRSLFISVFACLGRAHFGLSPLAHTPALVAKPAADLPDRYLRWLFCASSRWIVE